MKQKANLKILLFCISFCLLSFNVTAQIWLEDEAIYNEAEDFMVGEEYEEALPLYQLLEKKGISNSNISYKIGACFLNILGQKSRAIPYLVSASENVSRQFTGDFNEKNAPLRAYLLLGKAYRINYEFNKAIQSFEKFKELNEGTDFEKLADFEIKCCLVAKTMIANPSGSVTELIADQSEFSLYNPVCISPSDIYFMEKRKFYDAINQSSVFEGAVQTPENITPIIGSDGDYILSSISGDGSTMILTTYSPGNGSELFFTTKNQEKIWNKVQKFPEPINSPFNETAGSLSSDGKTLYFCSNRSGGEGGNDIYVSTKLSEESWSNPVNLGKEINSSFDEDAVYINSDGTQLFFASQGHLNMGGYDLFVSKGNGGHFGAPVNLGSPVSSPDDDKYISPFGKNGLAYIYKLDSKVSNKYQIYKVILDENSVTPKLYVQGKLLFSDTITQKPVKYDVTNDTTRMIVHEDITLEDGSYSFVLPTGSYKINFFYSDAILATQTIVVDPQSSIDELTLDSPEWRTISKKSPTIIYVPDILFSFDSYVIQPKYFSGLDSLANLLKNFKQLNIIVSGHTDALGADSYNQILSERRAAEVKQYFISKGISIDRITTLGKGSMNPVAINRNSNGSDNEKGRMYNRRVSIEVKVHEEQLKIINSDEVPDELKLKTKP